MPPKKRMRGATAFGLFLRDQWQSRSDSPQSSHNRQDVTTYVKITAEKWANLSEDTKAHYKELAKKSQMRAKRRREAGKKNVIKRPRSAYILFCAEKRGEVRKSHPTWSLVNITRELARLWRSLSPSGKAKYIKLAEQDKRRYEAEVKRNPKVSESTPPSSRSKSHSSTSKSSSGSSFRESDD